MNPEEKALLERTLRLSEENNRILKRMHRAARYALIWGFLKAVIVVVPLVLGFIYLQPFFDEIRTAYQSVFEFINSPQP